MFKIFISTLLLSAFLFLKPALSDPILSHDRGDSNESIIPYSIILTNAYDLYKAASFPRMHAKELNLLTSPVLTSRFEQMLQAPLSFVQFPDLFCPDPRTKAPISFRGYPLLITAFLAGHKNYQQKLRSYRLACRQNNILTIHELFNPTKSKSPDGPAAGKWSYSQQSGNLVHWQGNGLISVIDSKTGDPIHRLQVKYRETIKDKDESHTYLIKPKITSAHFYPKEGLLAFVYIKHLRYSKRFKKFFSLRWSVEGNLPSAICLYYFKKKYMRTLFEVNKDFIITPYYLRVEDSPTICFTTHPATKYERVCNGKKTTSLYTYSSQQGAVQKTGTYPNFPLKLYFKENSSQPILSEDRLRRAGLFVLSTIDAKNHTERLFSIDKDYGTVKNISLHNSYKDGRFHTDTSVLYLLRRYKQDKMVPYSYDLDEQIQRPILSKKTMRSLKASVINFMPDSENSFENSRGCLYETYEARPEWHMEGDFPFGQNVLNIQKLLRFIGCTNFRIKSYYRLGKDHYRILIGLNDTVQMRSSLNMWDAPESGVPTPLWDKKSFTNSLAGQFVPPKILYYQNREEKKQFGYFVPPRKGTPPYPLIVDIHGGPKSRDHFENSQSAQAFSCLGYAVWMPQFRGLGSSKEGSIGGKTGDLGLIETSSINGHYLEALNDVEDSIAHMIQTGLADPKRLATTGGSFGGYASAALQTRPSLGIKYLCGIQEFGFFNLDKSEAYSESTTRNPHAYLNTHAEFGPKEKWKALSPVYNTRHIRVPQLITHGKRDRTVQFSQSESWHQALLKSGHRNVFFMQFSDERHGYINLNNRYLNAFLQSEFLALSGMGGRVEPGLSDEMIRSRSSVIDWSTSTDLYQQKPLPQVAEKHADSALESSFLPDPEAGEEKYLEIR